MSTRRHGFTLVELLVVIVIIGMLVALLLPAVRSATEAARQAQCLNNMKEIGTAIMSYEAEKGHLPGYRNPAVSTTNTALVTWPMAIMANLGRKDLLDRARSNAQWDTSVQINQFICPDDPQKGTPDSSGRYCMSYVVPFGSGLSSPSPTAYFVDRSAATSTSGTAVQIGQITNPGQTVMLGERTWTQGDTSAAHCPHAPAWYDATTADTTSPNGNSNAGGALTFTWPTYSSSNPGQPLITPTILFSHHPAIVVLYFFDGHGEKVRDDNPTNLNADGTTQAPGVLVPQ